MGICVISQQETFSVREDRGEAGMGRVSAGIANAEADATDQVRCSAAFSRCAGCVRRTANWKMEIAKVRWSFCATWRILRAATVGVEIPAHGECEFCAGGSQHDADAWSRHAESRAKKSMWRAGSGPQQILADPE